MDVEVLGLPDGMTARPGSRRDADRVLELLQDWDLRETGEIDTDLSDVLLRLPVCPDAASPLAVLVWAGGEPKGELVAAGFLADGEGEVYVRPAHEQAAAVERAILSRLISSAERCGMQLRLQVSADAEDRKARYAAAGLSYAYSIQQYRRALPGVPEPEWPAAVTVTDWVAECDAREVHALIRAAFREVPGQPDRDWPAWSAQILGRADVDVLAVRDGSGLVGAAVLSSYDSYGHVRQLAVHQSRRGLGLGRALLLASFQRFASYALPEVRLGVYASNATAVRLYASAGMTLLSESQVWTAPD